MKPWTLETVAVLFTEGGFAGIAEAHNEEIIALLKTKLGVKPDDSP